MTLLNMFVHKFITSLGWVDILEDAIEWYQLLCVSDCKGRVEIPKTDRIQRMHFINQVVVEFIEKLCNKNKKPCRRTKLQVTLRIDPDFPEIEATFQLEAIEVDGAVFVPIVIDNVEFSFILQDWQATCRKGIRVRLGNDILVEEVEKCRAIL